MPSKAPFLKLFSALTLEPLALNQAAGWEVLDRKSVV